MPLLTGLMAETLYIAEIFCSIQGEGMLTGTPSVFVRTSGCNLRCTFCDTPYTSWEPRGEKLAIANILSRVEEYTNVRHVVLTGGEPMIARRIEILARELDARGYHITVETAGTVFREDMPVSLYSISPKLSNSTPRGDLWSTRHERRRLAKGVIEKMMASAEYQLKFVIAGPEDLVEVEDLVTDVSAARERVLLMPEGVSAQRLDQVASWLVPICIERGFRYCDRLHVRLYGHTPGR